MPFPLYMLNIYRVPPRPQLLRLESTSTASSKPRRSSSFGENPRIPHGTRMVAGSRKIPPLSDGFP